MDEVQVPEFVALEPTQPGLRRRAWPFTIIAAMTIAALLTAGLTAITSSSSSAADAVNIAMRDAYATHGARITMEMGMPPALGGSMRGEGYLAPNGSASFFENFSSDLAGSMALDLPKSKVGGVPGVSSIGVVNPLDALKQLSSKGLTVTQIANGPGGVQRYRFSVDLQAMADASGAASLAGAKLFAKPMTGTVTVDPSNGQVVFTESVDLGGLGSGGAMTISMTVTPAEQTVVVQAPPADEVFHTTPSALQGLAQAGAA